ncbi:MAG: lysine--tRNA ligase, partial [Candidatus Magasanikbacteria bacterium CG10_big_fil_rev_8_21_14_0_10_38_6]
METNNTPQLNINDEREVRLQKLHDLEAAGINPYPNTVQRKHTIQEATAQPSGNTVQVVGRIMAKRDMGKLTFVHIEDQTGKIQVVYKKDELSDEQFKLFTKKIDIADIIGVEGTRFVTKKGEESILITNWTLLAKALRPLPDKYHGLQDDEMRYRKRYLDFLVNKDQKEKIIVRSHILRYMREFFNDKGFIEVETPILETVAS